VSEALRVFPSARTVLDIGSGSGCVAIAMAKSLSDATVISVDISLEALELARRNAELNAVYVEFRHGSLFEPVAGEHFDLILSNPPYISTTDIEKLQPEVRDFEPKSALDGGADGLDFYRLIIPAASQYLHPDGWLLLEVGIGQSEEVTEIFAKNGFSAIFSAQDLGGVERVAGGQLKNQGI